LRFDSYKDFITEAERVELIAWIDEGVKNKSLTKGKTREEGATSFTDIATSYTTRTNNNLFSFPKVAFDIQQRIIRSFSFTKGSFIEPFLDSSDAGMVAQVTYSGGDTYKHTDPRNGKLHSARFNVLLQAAEEGGELFIEGVNRNIKERELHAYMATNHEHWVSKAKGSKSRYIWIFGFSVPKDDWENFKIKRR